MAVVEQINIGSDGIRFTVKSFLNDGITPEDASAIVVSSVIHSRGEEETVWSNANVVADQNADTPTGHHNFFLDSANFETPLQDDDNIEIVGIITNSSGSNPFVRIFDVVDPDADNPMVVTIVSESTTNLTPGSVSEVIQFTVNNRDGSQVTNTTPGVQVQVVVIGVFRNGTALPLETSVFESTLTEEFGIWSLPSQNLEDDNGDPFVTQEGDRFTLVITVAEDDSNGSPSTAVQRTASFPVVRRLEFGPVIL